MIGCTEMSWLELLEHLRVASEEDCKKLLEEERNGKRRFNYLLRIYSRLNKLRYARERRELLEHQAKAGIA